MGQYEVLEDVCTSAELQAERAVKLGRVQAMLAERGIDAVLIMRHENIAWFTAGKAEVRVGLLRETGTAGLLVTRDRRVFYLTTNNEAARLKDEEFGELGYEAVVQPWYAADQEAAIRSVVGVGTIACDAPNGTMQVVSLNRLREELTAGEILRYRWLGKRVAEAAAEVLLAMEPGVSERTLQAMLGERLIRQGILPSVYLDAFDDRIFKYRHAVPRDGVLKRFAMLGFCARRWGLSTSMTRFIHFGAMAQELEKKFEAVAEVNAALMSATREGTTAGELFEVAKKTFAATGYAGEELLHHQGGATGYLEREWVARPGGAERVGKAQAFAWNPNLQGAKIEDTVLLVDGKLEVLTAGVEGILMR